MPKEKAKPTPEHLANYTIQKRCKYCNRQFMAPPVMYPGMFGLTYCRDKCRYYENQLKWLQSMKNRLCLKNT